MTVIDVDEQAQPFFEHLRAQRRCIGTLNLRIAAMALSRDATLVTRNRPDFAGILHSTWKIGHYQEQMSRAPE